MSSDSGKSTNPRQTALKIASIYAVFSTMWILFSDQILFSLVHSADLLTKIQTLKGWLFIVVTATIIYSLLYREISAVKESEMRLRESEERFRDLIGLSPIGLALCDMNGTLESVNSAYAEIIGYSEKDALDLTYWDVTPEKFADQEKQQLEQLMRTGRYGPYEKEYRHKKGHLVPVRLNGILIKRDGVDYIWSSVEDISAIKEATKEKSMLADRLRQTQKMEAIGTLAGGVAHDFNNILAAVQGYTELTLLDGSCDSKTKSNLEQILKAAKRAKDLVTQILTFSSKQGDGNHVPVRLHDVLHEAVNLLLHTMPATVTLQLDIKNNTGVVLADPTQIHQIIFNLCTNAYHSLPESTGVIKIGLNTVELTASVTSQSSNSSPGNYHSIVVTDNGSGISPEIVDRIFEPFYTTKTLSQGTGMGLAVVHGIVQSHGGAIRVDSALGGGSSFEVLLPVLEDSSVDLRKQQADEQCRAGTENILLIDDEATLAELGKKSLETYGYSVLAMTSPLEALCAFKETPETFDLVVTDQTMPDMSGDILTEKILQIQPDIPIIICTGHSDIMSEEKAHEIGAKALLMKPINLEVLLEAVSRSLDGHLSISKKPNH